MKASSPSLSQLALPFPPLSSSSSSSFFHYAHNGAFELTLLVGWLAIDCLKEVIESVTLIHCFTPTTTGQDCNVKHWALFSMKWPGMSPSGQFPTFSSTSALILKLCDINHYQFKGNCLTVRTRHHVEVSNHGLVFTTIYIRVHQPFWASKSNSLYSTLAGARCRSLTSGCL